MIRIADAIMKAAANPPCGGCAGHKKPANQAWTLEADSGANPHQSAAASAAVTTIGTKTLLT
jgi:hypothetical protein